MTFLTDLAEAWRPWAWGATWQLALLVALIAGLLLGARKMPPRLRYALWLLVTIKVFLPPSLGLVWGIGTWGIEPVRHRAVAWVGSAEGGVAGQGGANGVDRVDQVAALDRSVPGAGPVAWPASANGAPRSLAGSTAPAGSSLSTLSTLSTPSTESTRSTKPAAPALTSLLRTAPAPWAARHTPFAVWLLGVAGFGAFVLMRYARFTRRLRDADEVTEGPLRVELERLAALLGKTDPPELLLSVAVSSPLLCGLFRPRIVLPANLPETLSADDLSNVLLHELIHWRRRDVAVGWLQLAGQALFWFHPLVWLANARARHERECACDEAALAVGRCAPKAYGESLLKVLLASEGRSAAALGFLGIFERGTRIQNRLEAIMNNSVRSRRGNLLGWIGLAVFALVCLPMFPAAKATGQGATGVTTPARPAPVALDVSDSKTTFDLNSAAIGNVVAVLQYDEDIPLQLSVGEGSVPSFKATSIRFEKRDTGAVAVLRYTCASGPKAKWRITIGKPMGSGPFMSTATIDRKEFENSGTILTAAFGEAGQTEFSLGGTDRIPLAANAKCNLIVECFLEVPAKPAANGSVEGTVRYGEDIPLELSVGEGPIPRFWTTSIRFEKRDGVTTATLGFTCAGGPKAKWRIALEVVANSGAVIARDEKEYENPGRISYAGYAISFLATAKFSLGDPSKILTDTKFRLTVECFPEPPATPAATGTADGTLKYGEDIPLKLSVGEGPVPNLAATSIRFEKRGNAAFGVLPYMSASGPKAKWRIAVEVLAKDGSTVVRDEKQFENSGAILQTAYEEPGRMELNLGDPSKIPADAKFRITVECFPVPSRPRMFPTAPTPSSAASMPSITSTPSTTSRIAATLSYVHDTAEGKRSLGASGHAVEFSRPEKAHFVETVHIYASRYGMPDPPQEDFHVYLLNEKKEVLADLKVPYSTVERGDMKWVDLRTPSVEVPDPFFVALAFNPAQTKGIYLGLDEAAEGGHSFTGLPGEGYEKWGAKPNEKGDWMVRVDLAEAPSGEKGVQPLADWKAPASTDPFAACTEAKVDAGESDDKQSYGGSGPAIQLRLSDFGLAQPAPSATAGQSGGAAAVGVPAPVGNPRLIGFRLYAARYGSGYDPAQTEIKVAILDSSNKVRWQGVFPYALFAYKSKWVDLVLKEPVAVRDLAGDDGILTVAFDPEAQQTKGIYFHYNKNPQASHSFAGTVARGFKPVADREWIVRAYFESAKQGEATTVRTANEVAPMQSPAQPAAPSKRAWGPEQATGAPDTTRSGDIETAWASLEPDGGAEWLELDYAPSFRANQVRIAETFNPGAVTALVLKDDQGTTITVVQVTDTTAQAPAFLEVPFTLTQRPVKSLRIVLDSRKVAGWNEIDAVELVGPEGRGWAAAARASSTYATRELEGPHLAGEPRSVHPPAPAPGSLKLVLEGRATDEKANPIEGLEVSLYGGVATRWKIAATKTDAEGYYRFDPCPWGSGTFDETNQHWDLSVGMSVSHPQYVSADGCYWWEPRLPAEDGSVVRRDFRMMVGGTLAGKVMDANGTPQPHLDLRVTTGNSSQSSFYFATGEDGTFKKTGLFPAAYTVSIDSRDLGYPVLGSAQVVSGQTTIATLALDPRLAAPPARAVGAPPRIVSTTPAVGATDVDPATAQITVTFDRDMDTSGYSWTGGGEYYPPSPERALPFWTFRSTCILPVRLSAGHFYRVGINSSSFENFSSAEGVPAPPSAIYFSTTGATDEVKALAQPPQVVKMEPANRATAVDPAKTTELRVTFNVPMGGGNSWCGGGPSFPAIPEGKRASWSDDRKTAILPVALLADKSYHLSLNAESFNNFASASGVALEPVPYTFTTGK